MAKPEAEAQNAAEWNLMPLQRIGSVDDSIYALAPIAQLSLGPHGLIYIRENDGSEQVRVFGPAGRFVRAIGRKGEGPGEFRDMSFMSWCGDTLFVTDLRLQRVVLFDTTGSLLETRAWTPPAFPAPLRRSVPTAALEGGTVLYQPLHDLELRDGRRPRPVPVVRTDWSGDVLDTLALLQPLEGLVFQSGTRRLVRAQPFQWLPILKPGPDGKRVFVVDFPQQQDHDSATVHVRAFDQGGGQLYSKELRLPLNRIPQTVVDSVYEAAARSMQRSGAWTLRQAEQAAHDQIKMPTGYPAVTTAVAGSDGSLWLGLWRQPDGGRPWIVLDPAGANIAEVVTPPGLSVRTVSPNTVWGVVHDELDVSYITEYRITKAKG